jgi:serine/threonine/tyrosine-interacting protein
MAQAFQYDAAIPAAPYAARPPSPPSITIPAPTLLKVNEPITCMPSYAAVDPLYLTAADVEIITQNKPQEAYDSVNTWKYEDRRTAQPILDCLYLGPSSIARDKKFLTDNGITMLLAARDSRMAQARLMGVDRVAKELGIQAEHIDVSGNQELIRLFPDAIRKINNHMLDIYRSQALGAQNGEQPEEGTIVIDRAQFRRGKVLVFCETGNDRSAGIVIAYLMAVFGMHMIPACQFIQFRRFCVSLDEEMKHLLQTYEGILNAQKTVHRHQFLAPVSSMAPATSDSGPSTDRTIRAAVKRGIDETLDSDDEMEGIEGFAADKDRYVDRPAFVPFVDRQDSTMG